MEALARAARALALAARSLERAAGRVDLTLAQYRVLALIAAGDERASLLADRLAVAKPTITAVVDGKNIPEAEVIDQDSFGLDVYSDGWSYRPADNSVEFHGTAIPAYNAEVNIYYLPVDGMPRELPF